MHLETASEHLRAGGDKSEPLGMVPQLQEGFEEDGKREPRHHGSSILEVAVEAEIVVFVSLS